MTRDKDFKRLVRTRMSATGERYTTARAALLRHRREEAGMVPVTVEVRVETLTEEEAKKRAETRVALQVERAEEPPETLAFAGWREEDRRQDWLLLNEVGGPRVLPIMCGPVEATAIAYAKHDVRTARPMTHDLLRDVVAAMGEAREVRITELRDTTFFAELFVVGSNGEERAVSCRPSDGIALALRADIPILVEESLFQFGGTQK